MKIEIRYEFDPKCPPHMFAVAEINGERIIRAGHTWDGAKERMKSDLPDIVKQAYGTVPEPEEIEI